MTRRTPFIAVAVALLSALAFAQGRGVAPEELLKPLGHSWPTYSGDYTGKRYSSLKQINLNTVKGLTLAWTARTFVPRRHGISTGIAKACEFI